MGFSTQQPVACNNVTRFLAGALKLHGPQLLLGVARAGKISHYTLQATKKHLRCLLLKSSFFPGFAPRAPSAASSTPSAAHDKSAGIETRHLRVVRSLLSPENRTRKHSTLICCMCLCRTKKKTTEWLVSQPLITIRASLGYLLGPEALWENQKGSVQQSCVLDSG